MSPTQGESGPIEAVDSQEAGHDDAAEDSPELTEEDSEIDEDEAADAQEAEHGDAVDDLEQTEEDSEIDEDEAVFDLSCSSCSRLLCQRGQRVRLVADSSVSLFSTDFTPCDVEEGLQLRPHGTCQCQVRDTMVE